MGNHSTGERSFGSLFEGLSSFRMFCTPLLLICIAAAADAFRYSSVARIGMYRTTLRATDSNTLKEQVEAEFVNEELVRRVEAEVRELTGGGLDGLMNPSTVLNLERDLIDLNNQYALEKDSGKRAELNAKMQKKADKLFVEKRTIMRGWLKGLFLFQSALAAVVSLAMVNDSIPGQHLPLSLQVLGFWMWYTVTPLATCLLFD